MSDFTKLCYVDCGNQPPECECKDGLTEHGPFTPITVTGRSTAMTDNPTIPDVVKPLKMLERRSGYWGGDCSFGYQVAHTVNDSFRVRLNGKVICKDIKGFQRAVAWANQHHKQRILSAINIDAMRNAALEEVEEQRARLMEVDKRNQSAGWLLKELNEAVILIFSALISQEKDKTDE